MSPAPARHQRASLILAPRGLPGYVLDGVAYGLARSADVRALAARHAGGLGFLEWHDGADLADRAAQEIRAERAVHLARALLDLAAERLPDADGQAALRADLPGAAGVVRVRTDGSADKADGQLSLGHLLGDRRYALNLPGAAGHEGLAEREAIRVALTHARALGFTHFEVQSDHKFHMRRYDEDLIHRGRRKSASLERLDALVDELGDAVTFEYVGTLDTDAPHRMALHARALSRLDLNVPLSRAQRHPLRRVHFALKAGGSVLY
ncbi:hypothetical protein [Deinococcus radiotolerans]|uniref:RNase H type-1 domain-containing protein n=1 Tax=Deinococcus radiotolerans TaxID=1309407 RepID=A0ABQ2FJM8_9DEIO|nr:hypothetical protein [Deinococcus radiotolerans]GGL01229.1 hypothetical protein GCM10010844_19550 [Deinococcus radiotolerans]